MTLEEAIKTLSDAAYGKSFTLGPDFYDSLKLGIEACKFTLAVRGTILSYATLPLPGETK